MFENIQVKQPTVTIPVGQETDGAGNHACYHIHWNCQQVCLGRLVAYVLSDHVLKHSSRRRSTHLAVRERQFVRLSICIWELEREQDTSEMILGRNNAKAYNGISLPEYTITMRSDSVTQTTSITEIEERTVEIRLPIRQTCHDILPFETFAGGTKLVVLLKSPDDDRTLCFGQKRGVVREIDNDPIRQEARNDRYETLDDEYPRPGCFSTDAIQVGDGSLQRTPRRGECLRRTKEIGMLTASRPPNAPDIVAAEKNTAILIPNSLRLYQLSSPNHTISQYSSRAG